MVAAGIQQQLSSLQSRGLLRRRRILESPQGAHVCVDGRDYVAFCSNDYLGLANHPALVAAAVEGARLHGVGAGASHLVSGHSAAHEEFERAAARFVGMSSALLFSSGYLANIGVVSALMGREDEVFADKLNHASLNDAALLSRAKFTRYAHLDLAALERLLGASHARRKMVATDAVFSMDGDIAPLPQILALCERFDAWLLVDDAHGFGVLGEHGRGSLSHFRLASEQIIYMATLGKSAGVCGAFVAGAADVAQLLVNRARSYIYTTAMPPLLARALCTSLSLIEADDWRRRHLAELIAAFRKGLDKRGWKLLPSDTAIQPLLVGENAAALAASAQLAQQSILVPAIRPPTVPQGTARLRVSLSAAHDAADVDRLLAALREIQPHSP
jgi:8-amino-7-oxononanoate synthase